MYNTLMPRAAIRPLEKLAVTLVKSGCEPVSTDDMAPDVIVYVCRLFCRHGDNVNAARPAASEVTVNSWTSLVAEVGEVYSSGTRQGGQSPGLAMHLMYIGRASSAKVDIEPPTGPLNVAFCDFAAFWLLALTSANRDPRCFAFAFAIFVSFTMMEFV